MSDQRSLADLIASEAPVGARRALAITLAMVDELIDLSARGLDPGRFTSERVLLGSDGSVAFEPQVGTSAVHSPGPTEVWSDTALSAQPSECAASVGLVLFELLMARAPVASADAFEPGITSRLTPTLSALIVRSVSDTATQWPTLDLWSAALSGPVGGAATPTPPGRKRRNRRRTIISVALLVVLAAITVYVVFQAPGWWDNATRSEGSMVGYDSSGQPARATS